MTQAFYTAIGGMAAGQTQISVVADNIANMNTIGFKASNVNFADVYYRTSSTGQAPTGSIGGINPKQTGIGVQTASITRNFSAGTTLSTGLSTDLCINGSSFFTVASPTVEILYTRDGNFTVDANGNMVTSSGYKLLGTANTLDTTSSTDEIKIPTYIETITTPSTYAEMESKQLSELNGIKSGGVKGGTVFLKLYDDAGNLLNGTVDADGNEIVTPIDIESTTTIKGLKEDIFKDMGVTVDFVDGELVIKAGTYTDAGGTSTAVGSFKIENGTSNFVTQFGIGKMDPATKEATSDVVNYHQTIGEGNMGSQESQNYTSVTISENGIIEVKYGNNDTLSVMEDPSDPTKVVLKYTLNDGTVITGNDLTINDQLVTPANLQIQMASFINPQGLTAQGNNTYANAPNAGMVLYGSISSTAFGSVKAGVLEGSNVDLASEFADMVVSQRAIEANSRVFSTTNEILQTLAQLGR